MEKKENEAEKMEIDFVPINKEKCQFLLSKIESITNRSNQVDGDDEEAPIAASSYRISHDPAVMKSLFQKQQSELNDQKKKALDV